MNSLNSDLLILIGLFNPIMCKTSKDLFDKHPAHIKNTLFQKAPKDNKAIRGFLLTLDAFDDKEKIYQKAETVGDLSIIQFLDGYISRKEMSFSFGKIAAEHGHTDILEYYCAGKRISGSTIMTYAIKGGRAHAVENIYKIGTSLNWFDKVNRNDWGYLAAECGNVDILEFLKDKIRYNCLTFDTAVTYGKLEVVKYLISERCPWAEPSYRNANPEIQEYLQELIL